MAKNNAFITKCKNMSHSDAKKLSNTLRFFSETEGTEVEQDGVVIKKTDAPNVFEAHDSEDNSVTEINQNPDDGSMDLKDKGMSVVKEPADEKDEKETTVFKVVDGDVKNTPEVVKTPELTPAVESPEINEETQKEVKNFTNFLKDRGIKTYTSNDVRHYAHEKGLSFKSFSDLESAVTDEAHEVVTEKIQEDLVAKPDGEGSGNDKPKVEGTKTAPAAVEEARTFSGWRKLKNFSDDQPANQTQVDQWAEETNPPTKEYKEMCKKYGEISTENKEVFKEEIPEIKEEKVEELKPENEEEFKSNSEGKLFSITGGGSELDRLMKLSKW